MKKLTAFTIILAAMLAACAPIIPQSPDSTPIAATPIVGTAVAGTSAPPGTGGAFRTPAPPTPIPTLKSALTPSELKYRVLDQFPDFFFCDPDLYPVARGDELAVAQERFPELQANQEEFQAILNHNSLRGFTTFTDDQKLLVYREYKKLNAIQFELIGDKYQFRLQTGSEGVQGFVITATIDGSGAIEIQSQEPGYPSCPRCLALGTRIDTPRGFVSVENLRIGDPVWTMNEAGERIQGTIVNVGRAIVPENHQVVHLILEDGRELWASPGHPTADGRRLGDLHIGDGLDGAQVILAERIAYQGVATYDVLPSGGTGFYWANGILMGSTLSK